MYESVSEVGMFVELASKRGRVGVVVDGYAHSRIVLWLDDYSMSTHRYSELVEGQKPSHNTGSPKLSGAVCRWCYGHKDMCGKCVFGSEFSPAAQHRAGA